MLQDITNIPYKLTHRWTYLSSDRYWSPYATSKAICVNPAELMSSASFVFWPTIWRLDSRNVFKSPSNTTPINTRTTASQRTPCSMPNIIIINIVIITTDLLWHYSTETQQHFTMSCIKMKVKLNEHKSKHKQRTVFSTASRNYHLSVSLYQVRSSYGLELYSTNY